MLIINYILSISKAFVLRHGTVFLLYRWLIGVKKGPFSVEKGPFFILLYIILYRRLSLGQGY